MLRFRLPNASKRRDVRRKNFQRVSAALFMAGTEMFAQVVLFYEFRQYKYKSNKTIVQLSVLNENFLQRCNFIGALPPERRPLEVWCAAQTCIFMCMCDHISAPVIDLQISALEQFSGRIHNFLFQFINSHRFHIISCGTKLNLKYHLN